MQKTGDHLLRLMLLGLVAMVLPFVVFVPLGLLLDKRFGTPPWFFVAGLVLSAIGAMIISILKARRLMRLMAPDASAHPPTQEK